MRDKSVNSDIRSLNANNPDYENQSHVSYLEAQRSPIFKRDKRCEMRETRDERRDARNKKQDARNKKQDARNKRRETRCEIRALMVTLDH